MFGNFFGGGEDNNMFFILIILFLFGGFGGNDCCDRDRDCNNGIFGDNMIWIIILFLCFCGNNKRDEHHCR